MMWMYLYLNEGEAFDFSLIKERTVLYAFTPDDKARELIETEAALFKRKILQIKKLDGKKRRNKNEKIR